MSDIEGDTHSNDPASPDYSPSAPTWIGETFTYNGGSSTVLEINDDDSDFEDAYVETGGAQTLAQDVTINGTTYLAGSVVENEFSMLDGAGNEIWVVRIDGVNVGFSYPAGNDPSPGEDFVPTVGRDGDPADSGDGVSSSESYATMICFAPGTLIETPGGTRRVETLRIGDLVTTLDDGVRPIRWLSRRAVEFGDDIENGRPILISAGALAPGMPRRNLVVSPQHKFMFHDRGRSRDAEVFVPAKALTILPGIRVMHGKRKVEYHHFALDRHQVVMAEGVLTESCYLGAMVLQDIPVDQRPRLKAIFPHVDFDPGRGYGPTARPVIRVQEAQQGLKSGRLTYRSVPASQTALVG